MLAALILFSSTFATEVANSIGKQSVRQRRENVYDLAFLGLFWGLIFLLITILFGAPLRFSAASLPTLIPRLVFEVAAAYLISEAIIRADRTTFSFLRLITIPLLLIVDIALGYQVTPLQIGGIILLFSTLILTFRHNPTGRRGAWIAALSGIVNVGTVSLYKYDITHYNSIVVEQGIALTFLLVIFGILSARHHHAPLRLLVRPTSATQSLASGLTIALESFAMGLAPASVVITLKRSFALMWAIVFGGTYFHEHSLRRKVSSAAFLAASVVLIASPTLLRFWPK